MSELALSSERKHGPMLGEESFPLLDEQLGTKLASFRPWYLEERGLLYEGEAADDKT